MHKYEVLLCEALNLLDDAIQEAKNNNLYIQDWAELKYGFGDEVILLNEKRDKLQEKYKSVKNGRING